MARVIATYDCEWKKAIEDPADAASASAISSTATRTDDNVRVRRGARPDPAGHAPKSGAPGRARWRHERMPASTLAARLRARRPRRTAPASARCVDGRQIARVPRATRQRLRARQLRSRRARANVLSRGLVGDLQGERVVASPIYKHHFSLRTRPLPRGSARSASAPIPRACVGRPRAGRERRSAAAAASRLVVVGNGMAGMRTVEELLKLGVRIAYDITVFGAEPHGNYNRILLSPVLAGEKQRRRHHAAPRRVVHASTASRCTRAIRSSRSTASAASCARATASRRRYDRLLLATGSEPDHAADAGQGPAGRRHVPRPRRRRDACSKRPRARPPRGGDRRRPARAGGGATACASAAWT